MADDVTIPKHRFDEESSKRKEAEKKISDLEAKLQALEKAQAEQDSNYQKLYEDEQKRTQRLQARLNDEERKTAEAEANLASYKRRAAFSSAASGIVRAEAIDDAFSMIPASDFENLKDLSDTDKIKALAQDLVEKKPYLADSVRGAGSGGSERQVVLSGQQDGTKKPLPFGKFNRRRIT